MKNEFISEHSECLSEKLRGRTYRENKKLEVDFSALNWCNGKCCSPVTFSTSIYYTISSCFPFLLMQAFMFLLNNFYDTVGQKIRSPFLSSRQVQARHSAGKNHKFSEDSVSQKLHFQSAY